MCAAFKIEKFLTPEDVVQSGQDVEEKRYQEIIKQLEALHKKMDQGAVAARPPAQQAGGQDEFAQGSDDLHLEVTSKRVELARLKDEMRSIYNAIEDTKTQILTIQQTGAEGEEIARVAEELSAIVKGTEVATDTILHSAEAIETQASNLVASLRDESQQAMACEIQENIVNIFEACNFQDLTGQRITKVVKTFCFIEARIMKMMDIWGGAEAFLNIAVEEHESTQGDNALINGPALETDDSIATQDEIDALFD